MHAEGWRRLWELIKWVASIGAGIWCIHMMELHAPIPVTSSTPETGMGYLLGFVIATGFTYGGLSALEWVWRGFRPKAV